MKLYTKPGACSLADHIALHWSGLPFEVEVVDAAAMKSPAFLTLNPAGAVPVLVEGDWALTQNAAILHYIADKAPARALDGGNDARQRAEVNRWLAFVNADVHPQFRPLFGATRYLEEAAIIARTQEDARQRLHEMFLRIDGQLAGNTWVAGTATPSVADAYIYVTLRWARGVGVDLAGMQALERFEQQMRADPGVQAALKEEGLS
ncbi:glutathione S-transferase N-terminal domain-containing protein [Stenotrophomonas sp. YIM B06876]|uniref:glutathione S-transferase family protein n=1 Tax=Stenotrophomonas sp. YIM B06876 TaxID=3060211 RepID=UPI0027389AE4|nr:glutathione S-transferase N-terminal domain-containing protein [Stenotrophomonas sp. YIM B06876]